MKNVLFIASQEKLGLANDFLKEYFPIFCGSIKTALNWLNNLPGDYDLVVFDSQFFDENDDPSSIEEQNLLLEKIEENEIPSLFHKIDAESIVSLKTRLSISLL